MWRAMPKRTLIITSNWQSNLTNGITMLHRNTRMATPCMPLS